MKQKCWHTRIRITGIVIPKRRGSRLIGGECQDCYRRVVRWTGKKETKWENEV
jgi:hypothetical protein